MKVFVEGIPVETRGLEETVAYGVIADAFLMKSLSGLYSDIPWAIVREYGTNMADGVRTLLEQHPDASPAPSIIHAPTEEEPWLGFRDFGIGMEQLTLQRIYTVFGASLHRGSNDATGGFGYGSKAAYAYHSGQHWVVSSIKDGLKNIGLCYKDERGVPTMGCLPEEKTDEPSGTEVKIPILKQDFEAFRQAIVRFYKTYPLPLEVQNIDPELLVKWDYSYERELWAIRVFKDSGDYYSRQSRKMEIVMGGVPYPVTGYRFPTIAGVEELNEFYELEIRAPVGSLQPTPSREAIEWNQESKDAICSLLKTALKEIREIIEQELSTASTLWEAAVRVYNFHLRTDYIPRDVQWGGKDVWKLFYYKAYFYHLLDLRTKEEQEKREERRYSFRHIERDGRRARAHRPEKENHHVTLHPGSNAYVFIDDLEKPGAVEQVKYWIDKTLQPEDRINPRSMDVHAYLIKTWDEASPSPQELQKSISELLEGAPVLLVSSIYTKIPREPRSKSTKAVAAAPEPPVDEDSLVYSYQPNGWCKINPPEGDGPFYYCKLSHRVPTDIVSYRVSALGESIDRYQLLGPEPVTLYGVGSKQLARTEKDSRWIYFPPFLQAKILDRIQEMFPNGYALAKYAQGRQTLRFLAENYRDHVANEKLRNLLVDTLCLETDERLETMMGRLQDCLIALYWKQEEDYLTKIMEELEDLLRPYPILHFCCYLDGHRRLYGGTWDGAPKRFIQMLLAELEEVPTTNEET